MFYKVGAMVEKLKKGAEAKIEIVIYIDKVKGPGERLIS